MAALGNIIGFAAATALMLLAWLIYLWCNNLISRMTASLLQEILGGVLSFGLFIALGLVLYFFSLPFSMGVLTISVLMMVGYAVRKTFRSVTT